MNQNLTVPTVTVEGTSYVVRWDEGVKVECARLYEHRDKHIEATVMISDVHAIDGPRLLGPVRTYITKSWRTIISELDDVSHRSDWRQRLTQLSELVQQEYLAGSPVVALHKVENPVPTQELITNILWEGTVCIVYGAGGIGKSIFGLNFIQGMHLGRPVADHETIQKNALWLDWETTENLAYWRNAQLLTGIGLEAEDWHDPVRPDSPRGNMVFYKEMVGSLADNVESVADEIDRYNISVLLVDSAIPACGGEAESTKPSQEFFNALRAVKPRGRDLSTIVIAHVTKESANTKPATPTPFGSTVWKDRARDTYFLQASQKKNASYTDFALHHIKSNMGPLNNVLGYRLSWADGCTMERIDIKENKELITGLPIADQAHISISQNGALSTDELADAIGESKTSISTMLSRDDRFVSNNGKWEPSEIDF